MEQRTPEWFAERIGKVTASRVADVVARTKSGYAASRANYMAELVCERLTGKREEALSTPRCSGALTKKPPLVTPTLPRPETW